MTGGGCEDRGLYVEGSTGDGWDGLYITYVFLVFFLGDFYSERSALV